jgi:hypothetical protein
VPLSAVHRLLIVNLRGCARVAHHGARPADSREMRGLASRKGRFGAVAYLGGKLEERLLKMSLPENSSRGSVGWRWINSEEIVDKLLFEC